MFEIIDNFLTEEEFIQIYNLISSSEFPWFFGKVASGSNYFQLTHCFYQNDEPTVILNILGF
jgi:hypothetical protein